MKKNVKKKRTCTDCAPEDCCHCKDDKKVKKQIKKSKTK